MSQSKLESKIEATVNIGTGFIVSYIVWNIIVWTQIFNIQINQGENLIIVLIFTVTSWLRSYYWRRFFANGFHMWVHEKVKNFL